MSVSTKVFVTLGTDHHPFDRLVDWTDRWAREAEDVEVLVQHGATRPPAVARGRDFFGHGDLLEAMRWADVVVTQGGPGSIMDSRACGHLPIVVPRTATLAECVDEHQVAFSQHLHGAGLIALALDERAYHDQLHHAVGEPGGLVLAGGAGPTAATARTIEEQLSALVTRPRGSRLRRPRLRVS